MLPPLDTKPDSGREVLGGNDTEQIKGQKPRTRTTRDPAGATTTPTETMTQPSSGQKSETMNGSTTGGPGPGAGSDGDADGEGAGNPPQGEVEKPKPRGKRDRKPTQPGQGQTSNPEQNPEVKDDPQSTPNPGASGTNDKDTTGKDTTGKDTTGKDTTGKDTTGKDTTGKDTTGKDTTGKDTTGKDTTGKDTPGTGRKGTCATSKDVDPRPPENGGQVPGPHNSKDKEKEKGLQRADSISRSGFNPNGSVASSSGSQHLGNGSLPPGPLSRSASTIRPSTAGSSETTPLINNTRDKNV